MSFKTVTRAWPSVFLCGFILCAFFFTFGTILAADPVSFKPLRIVSMTPNVTEIVMTLGATNSLVGISDYDQSPSLASLPKCGGLLNPNFERVLSLQPDILFVLGKMDRVHRFAGEHHIQAVSVNIDSFADLIREIEAIGKLLGREESAIRLVKSLQSQLAAVKQRAAALPHYRTLIVLGGESGSTRNMMAAGRASFISEMMEAAGGKNIFADQKQPYFLPSRESILALQPEAVFELHGDGTTTSTIPAWLTSSSTPAVKRNRVFVASHDFISIPGPRMVRIAELFLDYFEKFAADDKKQNVAQSPPAVLH